MQFDSPRSINFIIKESANVNAQIANFSEKRIIVESSHEEGEFISNTFYDPDRMGVIRRSGI